MIGCDDAGNMINPVVSEQPSFYGDYDVSQVMIFSTAKQAYNNDSIKGVLEEIDLWILHFSGETQELLKTPDPNLEWSNRNTCADPYKGVLGIGQDINRNILFFTNRQARIDFLNQLPYKYWSWHRHIKETEPLWDKPTSENSVEVTQNYGNSRTAIYQVFGDVHYFQDMPYYRLVLDVNNEGVHLLCTAR